MNTVKGPSNFAQLSETFVGCYREFDKYYKAWAREHQVSREDPSYLMFGTSGAGKSTLMARLLCNEDPDAFLECLRNVNSAGFSMINEVKVGHTPLKSTTLIPRGYVVHGMNIFDMPGFQDFDADRRIVISILHKCLLTRLRAVKFVVVLGIEALKTKVPARGILDYCDAFEHLFGDKFASYMEHVYFVLTKNDEVHMTEQEVRLSLFEIMMGAGSLGKASVSMFVTRLTQHHVIVDYSKFTADETREQIVEMLRKGVLANSEGCTPDTLNICDLEAQENDLTKKCGEELDRLVASIDARDKDFKAQRDRAMLDIAGLRRTSEGHMSDHGRQIQDASTAYAELAQVTESLTRYQGTREKIMEAVVRHSTQQRFCEEQLAYLGDCVAGFENVNFRCDVAKVPPGVTKTRFAVNVTVALNHHMTGGRYVILITRFEDDDSTLRGHISSVESWPAGQRPIIPKRLRTIEAFSNDIVIFHSQRAINKAPSDMKIVNDNKFITIDAKYDHPFKVFVYYSVPFSDTTAYEGLKEQFDSKLAASQTAADQAKQEAKLLDDSNSANTRRKAELITQHKMYVTKLRDSSELLSRQLQGIDATGKAKIVGLSEFTEASNPDTYPSLLNVECINEIYSSNKLRADLVARTSELRSRLDTFRSTITGAREQLEREVLMGVGALHEMIGRKPVIPEGLELPHHN